MPQSFTWILFHFNKVFYRFEFLRKKNIYVYILGSFKQKEKTQKKKNFWTRIWKKNNNNNYNKTTTDWAIVWFFRLNTLPNTTQFSTFSIFYYSNIFSHQTYITYFSFLIIFSYLFLTTHIFVFSIFSLHTFKFYHIFYTFTSTFCLPTCS